MTCPHCGNTTEPGATYCGFCGARLDTATSQQAAAPSTPPPVYEQPTYAHAVDTSSKGVQTALMIFALLLGLGAGIYFFYRTTHRAVADKPVPASVSPPAASPSPTLEPPTVASTQSPDLTSQATSQRSEQLSKLASSEHRAKKTKPVQDAPPQLLVDSNQPSQTANSPQESAPLLTPAPAPVTPDKPRRKAVQETNGEAAPLPAQTADSDSTHQPPPVNAQMGPPPPPNPTVPNPLPVAPSRPAYNGPVSGIATWSGKLDKNDTLTITGGTPSTGILSGAGLPGVPVRITIDQTNLGFAEMPNASNGYRRLVLKTHSKRDKITIHWSVVQ
jgi:hypothetical protein